MKWALYDFKTAKEPWFDEAEAVYLKKIRPYSSFDIIHLKSIRTDRDEVQIKVKFEENVLLEKLSKDDFVILLDERGKKLNSIQFAQTIEKAQNSGKKRGVFVIGGAFGVSDTIKNRADLVVSISDLVMNHLIAETVLLEQFYRAWTIIKKIPYHNA